MGVMMTRVPQKHAGKNLELNEDIRGRKEGVSKRPH